MNNRVKRKTERNCAMFTLLVLPLHLVKLMTLGILKWNFKGKLSWSLQTMNSYRKKSEKI